MGKGLNGNQIKLVACLAMLVDHMGLLLFPHLEWLRWIGRLAMPLFAYMIAEGCRHTRNRWRYFGRLCGLGLLCQLVYMAQGLMDGNVRYHYLNILLTFSVSLPLCFAWLDLEAAFRREGQRRLAWPTARFLLILLAVVMLPYACEGVGLYVDVWIEFDYGLPGMLLPLCGLFGRSRSVRLAGFGVGLLLFCGALCGRIPYVWYALPALLLLWVYNGKRGCPRWGWAFYGFYPVHLAVLYGISLMV